MKNPSRRSRPGRQIPLSEVRRDLSALLRQLTASAGTVGITVHGKVVGYLVAAERIASYEAGAPTPRWPVPLKGSARLSGDLAEASASLRAEVEAAIDRTARGLR
jgi:antitoxin (DNA-binding transcriptional repressor) of toxin-antitoxin stability system